jgi:hypothetical protein
MSSRNLHFSFFSVGASRSSGAEQPAPTDDQVRLVCEWQAEICQRQFQPAHWFNEAARTARPQRLAANIDPLDSLCRAVPSWRRLMKGPGRLLALSPLMILAIFCRPMEMQSN